MDVTRVNARLKLHRLVSLRRDTICYTAREGSISPSSIVPSLLPVRTVEGVRLELLKEEELKRTDWFFGVEIDGSDCAFVSREL